MHAMILALLLAQPQVPSGPPVVPQVPASDIAALPLDYTTGAAQAVREGKPFVFFYGTGYQRPIVGAVIGRQDYGVIKGFENDAPCIIVSMPARDWLDWRATLPAGATDAQIRATFAPKAVQPVAAPFERAGPSSADDSPWLPVGEQQRIRAMIPKGVPVSERLKFFKQAPAFQYLFTSNSVPYREIRSYRGRDPWRTSGGAHGLKDAEWYNVRGFDLPGKIKWWEEHIDVGAYAPVRQVRTAFPKGTLAYDVLIKRGDPDYVFSVRVHEKLSDEMHDWDDGTAYGPKADLTDAAKQAWSWSFPADGIQARSTVYTVASVDPRAEFVPTRHVVDDGKFVPKGFLGAGVACNTCHMRTGKKEHIGTHSNSMGFADYDLLGRGDDGRFWHPFDATGNVDTRWPLERKK